MLDWLTHTDLILERLVRAKLAKLAGNAYGAHPVALGRSRAQLRNLWHRLRHLASACIHKGRF